MSKSEDYKKQGFKITEMFMAEAGDKCFYGIIKRSHDTNGQPHLFSRITINDGYIQACSNDQRTLGKMLDEMCVMYLKGLHRDSGIYIIISGEKYFLN